MIKAIEVGPHFLTFYGSPRGVIIPLASVVYRAFVKAHPGLADIQQKNFTHETNDPNIYHPYGEPLELLYEHPTHFHIRYARTPTQGDIDDILRLFEKIEIPVSEDLEVFSLRKHRLLGKAEYQYPEYTGDTTADYLAYIDALRNKEEK